ncbi:hypothetical protein [Winogradskyella poriferorum]|uniref:Uncharacterized protein n=1 Tax=Winogradskyella poriferorum TaxID=307627 RepID=A0ABU7W3E6_9FLAO
MLTAKPMILKRTIALLFVMLFTLMICAPTIIISCDDSADISAFFGMNEEEEDTKVLFDKSPEELEDISIDINKKEYIVYTAKEYYIPHLNLISPPPERYLI